MLNHVVLVGRLVRTPELLLTESGKKLSLITLAVSRNFKNQNGEYDTDFLDCTLWTNVAENTAEYCKTGDVIGVKGRLQTRLMENEDGIKYKKVEVVAERVTFLSSAKGSKNNDENIDSSINIDVDDNDYLENDVNIIEDDVDNSESGNKKKGSKKKK